MNENRDIERVVREYLDGLYNCDTERLSRVFHPAAIYATAMGDIPLVLGMPEYFRIVSERFPPARAGEERKERIVSIDLAGPETAMVKLECRFFQKNYVDFLSFVRIDERWLIVSKVFRYENAV